MTFDDGKLRLYQTVNIAPPGKMPVDGLKIKDEYYYGYDNLGISRYFTALSHNRLIESVINIPDWPPVEYSDIVILENQLQYHIAMIQPTYDDDGLKITKLSLERISENYVIED